MHIGYTLNKIRKNRNMTQIELTQGIMKQSTYSRIEKGQLQVSAESLFLLTERLNITLNEFFYIHNNYNSSTRQQIIYSFSKMELVMPKEMKEEIKKIQDYLIQHNDQDLLMILNTYHALIALTEKNDLKQVRELASNVWCHMQKLDHWYINDIELLNAIIIYFPLNTAIEIMKTAIKRLDAYDYFEKDLTYLKIYFYLNLTSLFLESRQFDKCLIFLNSTQQKFKHHLTYQTLGFIYTRRAICKYYLQQPYAQDITDLKTLMHLFNDNKTLSSLLREIDMNIPKY